jgi:hypothetical protein
MGRWKGIVGREKIYNNQFKGVEKDTAIQIDVLNIKKEQELILEFISSNSKYPQGVGLALYEGDGYIEINGQRAKAMRIWEDAVSNKIKIFCFSTEGLVSVYNLYDLGSNHKPSEIRSQLDSCGMLVEQKDNKIIYRCNDVGFEPKFDSLVFSIEII